MNSRDSTNVIASQLFICIRRKIYFNAGYNHKIINKEPEKSNKLKILIHKKRQIICKCKTRYKERIFFFGNWNQDMKYIHHITI